jgi:hypothetical protein
MLNINSIEPTENALPIVAQEDRPALHKAHILHANQIEAAVATTAPFGALNPGKI